MPLVRLNTAPPLRDLRWFGWLAIPLASLLIGAACHWWLQWTWSFPIAIVCAAAGLAFGTFSPGWLRWLYVGWMALTFPLAYVMSHVLLGVTYFLVLTPIALWLRWRGRDRLQLRAGQQQTAWQERDNVVDKERYFRQW